MIGWEDIMKSAMPIAGAAGGFFAGGPGGMMAGAGLGQMASAGMGLLDDAPEFPGASASQQALLGIQMRNLEKLQGQQGLNAQQVQNISQGGYNQRQQQQQLMGAISMQNMSPIDKQNMVRGFMNMLDERSRATQETIAKMDMSAEAQRLVAVTQGGAVAAQQAEAVRQANAQRRQAQLNFEQAKMNTFTQNTMAAAQAIGVGIEYMDKNKKKEDPTDNNINISGVESMMAGASDAAFFAGEVNATGDVVGDNSNYDIRNAGRKVKPTMDQYGVSDFYFDYDYIMSQYGEFK